MKQFVPYRLFNVPICQVATIKGSFVDQFGGITRRKIKLVTDVVLFVPFIFCREIGEYPPRDVFSCKANLAGVTSIVHHNFHFRGGEGEKEEGRDWFGCGVRNGATSKNLIPQK
eukprot:TRINITY_DN12673_c0_g2_i1.p2 TRINITY_DN12673_c0_g2~~TRINITY_DN12673_c0_g2_i1.p2  ORF type:complete len:114 (+),score=6.49 TRINITY_DN12673_c0_g2_i1:3-344(+)